MVLLLEKARPLGERARIEALIAKMEGHMRRAFRQFLLSVHSEASRREVRLRLEAGDVEGALGVVDSHVEAFGDVIAKVFAETGAEESAALGRTMRRAAVSISFDPTHARAAALMRNNRLEFVREMTVAQRVSTRNAIVEGLRAGQGPVQVARTFRESIGLTEMQRNAVKNYRRALETGDAVALNRDLRDRRFDSSVSRLIESGEPLGSQRINTMVERYRERYLQLRAETIARTETQVVVNQARDEALTQALERASVPDSSVKLTWKATQDPRTRDTHAAMDGQVRPKGLPFVSPSGAQMMYPGDRSLGAPGSEVINCRCVLLTSISVD